MPRVTPCVWFTVKPRRAIAGAAARAALRVIRRRCSSKSARAARGRLAGAIMVGRRLILFFFFDKEEELISSKKLSYLECHCHQAGACTAFQMLRLHICCGGSACYFRQGAGDSRR